MVVRVLNNAYIGLIKVIKVLLTILMSALCLVVFGNVISRYFLHFSLAWSDEAARFLFIWVTFLGAVLANSRNEHMNLDFVVEKVPKKFGNVLKIIANIILLGILLIILKGGITVTVENYEWLSSALEISYGLVYSIVPVCSAILIIQTIYKIYAIIKSFNVSSKVGGA